MDQELFALRQQVYATAAAYHGAGSSYMAAKRTGKGEAQALSAFIAAAAPYDAALDALLEYLTRAASTAVRAEEQVRAQRTQELLHDEVAQLRALLTTVK